MSDMYFRDLQGYVGIRPEKQLEQCAMLGIRVEYDADASDYFYVNKHDHKKVIRRNGWKFEKGKLVKKDD